jgi:hypothetical protein
VGQGQPWPAGSGHSLPKPIKAIQSQPNIVTASQSQAKSIRTKPEVPSPKRHTNNKHHSINVLVDNANIVFLKTHMPTSPYGEFFDEPPASINALASSLTVPITFLQQPHTHSTSARFRGPRPRGNTESCAQDLCLAVFGLCACSCRSILMLCRVCC